MFYTNKEMCESLYKKSVDEIISELFEHYRINCMNMFKIDSQRMDWLIDNLKNGCENREEAINELVRLIILFSSSNEMEFDKGFVLQDGFSKALGCGYQWSYPTACESDGKLYVVYTLTYNKEEERGAVVSVIDLTQI